MDLKLAMISPQPFSTLGGIPLHIGQLAEAVADLGISLEVVAPAPRADTSNESVPFRVTKIPLNNRSETLRTLEFSHKACDYLIENRTSFDAIHGSQWSMFYPCRRKEQLALPLVTKFHTSFLFGVLAKITHEFRYFAFSEPGEILTLPLYAHIESACLRISDGVICVSNSIRSQLSSMTRTNRGRVTVIYNGIDLEKFRPLPNTDEIRKAYGLAEDLKIILYVGRFDPGKGVHHLIKSFRELFGKHRLKLIIVGDGEPRYSRYLQGIAKPKDGFAFFRCFPHHRLPELYNISNVCVVPSSYEGFGNVPLEAMACGKPVIATRVGGLTELVQHGHTGFLVDPDSITNQLTHFLGILISDDELSRRLGSNGREFVRNNFSWKQTAIKTLDFILQLTAD
jgi:spore coat protein SA